MSLTSKPSSAEYQKVSEQIDQLRTGLGYVPELPTLSMVAGEDAELIQAKLEEAHGSLPDDAICYVLWGDLPREEYVTTASLLAVLPTIRKYLKQRDDDDSEWRALAKRFDIDFDEVGIAV